MRTILNTAMLEQMKTGGAVFILFGGPECNVCQALKPQLAEMIVQRFPDMEAVYIDCEDCPAICGQHGVFSLPVAQVFIEGMKVAEAARAFSPVALMDQIERPYGLWLEARGMET